MYRYFSPDRFTLLACNVESPPKWSHIPKDATLSNISLLDVMEKVHRSDCDGASGKL